MREVAYKSHDQAHYLKNLTLLSDPRHMLTEDSREATEAIIGGRSNSKTQYEFTLNDQSDNRPTYKSAYSITD